MTKKARNFGVKFNLDLLNPTQKLAYAAFDQHDVLFLIGPAGTGKALTLDSKLYNKQGPILMKDVKIGDKIINTEGSTSEVIAIHPQGYKDVYKITFDDYSSVECCSDHLWKVSSNCNGWSDKVVDVKYLKKNYKQPSGRCHIYVNCTKPVNFTNKNNKINSYIMGILISEGSLLSLIHI